MTRPGAIGMRRAKDEPTGLKLKHETDDGRLYVPRGTSDYLFCATCDAEGRDPYVSPNRAGLDLPSWMKKVADRTQDQRYI